MTLRRVVSACAAIVLCAAVLEAQTAERALTADELVQMAIERNRDLLAARQRVAEAQGLLRQAGVRPAPTVETTGSTGRALGSLGEEEFTVGYFHPIETSGKRQKRIEVAEKSVELAKAQIADRVRLLTFDVKTRYADALAEQQKLEALGDLLSLNRKYSGLIEARVEQGDAAPLELELLLVDLSRTDAQQAILTGRFESALLELKKTVGLNPSASIQLSRNAFSPQADISLAELQSRALLERPDFRIAQLLEEQGSAEVTLVQAEARPDLTLSLTYSLRNSRFDQQLGIPALRDRDNILAFGLSVPLFSKRRNEGNIQAALARASGARLRREYLETQIRGEVEAAYRRSSASRRALEILGPGVLERSERNLHVVQQTYNLGQLRMMDVLNEQRRLIEIRSAYIDAKAEQIKSFAELERAVGGKIQ